VLRRIDPDGGWFAWRCRRLFDEALRVGGEGGIQRDLSGGVDRVGLAIVNLIRCHQTESGMVMGLVVPSEEFATELPGILDAAEAFWEPWLILQGLEVTFREWVVVGYMRPAL
jgi:hypothetical protein